VGWLFHSIIIGVGIMVSLGLGLFFKTQTDAARSFADAFSTIFSFIASYLEVHRILSAWFFWMGINLFSIWLYFDRGLLIYAALMVLYFALSIYGYIQWRKMIVVQ
jgi:nicotinamide mononucleotide transporter